MTTVESLKNRLEEIREDNRTLKMRKRSIEKQTHDLFFEAGFEAAIKHLQQNFCKPDVSGCKELEAQKPNKGITFKITKYDPEIFIDDVGDVE